jgi:hypothetical protein
MSTNNIANAILNKMTDGLIRLVTHLRPDDIKASGTPEEMIRTQAWKAAGVSFGSSLPPGPAGCLTIIPELLVVCKLQVNLVCKIAKHYGKLDNLTPQDILKILGGDATVTTNSRCVVKVGSQFISKPLAGALRAGAKIILRNPGKGPIGRIARKVAELILKRVGARLLARWMPVILAPVFAKLSYNATRDVGRCAVRAFAPA